MGQVVSQPEGRVFPGPMPLLHPFWLGLGWKRGGDVGHEWGQSCPCFSPETLPNSPCLNHGFLISECHLLALTCEVTESTQLALFS